MGNLLIRADRRHRFSVCDIDHGEGLTVLGGHRRPVAVYPFDAMRARVLSEVDGAEHSGLRDVEHCEAVAGIVAVPVVGDDGEGSIR